MQRIKLQRKIRKKQKNTYDDEWLTATGWCATSGAWCKTGLATTRPGCGAAAAIAKIHDTTN